jgi:hypothetical protein
MGCRRTRAQVCGRVPFPFPYDADRISRVAPLVLRAPTGARSIYRVVCNLGVNASKTRVIWPQNGSTSGQALPMKTGQVESVWGPGAAGAGSAGLFQVCPSSSTTRQSWHWKWVTRRQQSSGITDNWLSQSRLNIIGRSVPLRPVRKSFNSQPLADELPHDQTRRGDRTNARRLNR